MKKTTVTFGEYLKHKREEKQISLREVARTLGVSAPFLSDVENNRRGPLTEERLADLAKVLNLNEKEKAKMYDIVGKQKGLLAPDLNPYVTERPYVNAALRTARNLEANEEDWQWFTDYLSNKYSKVKEE
ncbi:MAG: helix-turn-helix transcriptional regulator [Sphaerochaetaceae bacterium]|jgi:transcriptional regulator with XRE-family HTH domain